MSFDFITLLNYNFKEEEAIPEKFDYSIGSNCIGSNPTGRQHSKDTFIKDLGVEGIVIGKLSFDKNLIVFYDTHTEQLRLFDEFFSQCILPQFTNNIIPFRSISKDITLESFCKEVVDYLKEYQYVIPYKRGGAKPHCSTFFVTTNSIQGYDTLAELSKMGLGAALFNDKVVITPPSKKQIKQIQEMGLNVYRNGVCLFPIM